MIKSLIRRIFSRKCIHLNVIEVGMLGCGYGCKIYRCEKCGIDQGMHNFTYGCKDF